MLAIPDLVGRLLYNGFTDLESVTWTPLGSTPATRPYKGHRSHIKLMKSLSSLGGGSWEGIEGTLAIPELDGRFLHD